MIGSPSPTRARSAGSTVFLRLAALVIAPVAVGAEAAWAGEALSEALKRRLYFYSGVDMARDTSYGWAGLAWAPFARMDEEGLRLRVQGGGGRYSYATVDVPGGWNSATKTEYEALAGWQFLRGPHALALYAGIAMIDNQLDMPDPANRDQGTQYGAKVVAEWFYRWDSTRTLTACLSATTADGALNGRVTAGWRVTDWMELGVESAASTDWLDEDARVGAFIMLPVSGQEMRAAGGWRWSSDEDSGAYLTLSVYAPY